jgi:hypothetical protein
METIHRAFKKSRENPVIMLARSRARVTRKGLTVATLNLAGNIGDPN